MKKKKQTTSVETDESIAKEIEKETTSSHYIDNKKFYDEMVKWKQEVTAAKKSNKPKPPVTPYIGQCFLDIATHLSYRPNFINYPYRDEMIGDGVENCLMYASNFDPVKSKNPFSYFTQIIYYAFLRRISREKKQMFIRYKMLESADNTGKVRKNLLDSGDYTSDDPLAEAFHLSANDIAKFSKSDKKKVKRKKSNTINRNSLDDI